MELGTRGTRVKALTPVPAGMHTGVLKYLREHVQFATPTGVLIKSFISVIKARTHRLLVPGYPGTGTRVPVGHLGKVS